MHIQHIFFDLDHTLWDYDRSAQETLVEIHQNLKLGEMGLSTKKLINAFYKVNDHFWHKYNIGEIDRNYIKTQRFQHIFEQTGVDVKYASDASDYFLDVCSQKPYLMPDALTALNYLQGRYTLHIITNGFLDAQGRKLDSAGIAKYFNVMVTSECANARKPSPEIFQYSLSKAGAEIGSSIMIGDNPRTDIDGAKAYGMKTLFYDPSGKKKSLADYTVQSHMELLKLF